MSESAAIAPALSIIVVSFNAPELLERCLRSISQQLEQSDPDPRIFRLSDARTDLAAVFDAGFKMSDKAKQGPGTGTATGTGTDTGTGSGPSRASGSSSPQDKPIVEVIIVRADASYDLGRMSRPLAEVHVLFPKFRWIDAGNEATVPKMRALGTQSCSGEVIALVEDDCVLSDAWCSSVLDAHANGYAAVGGAVRPGEFNHCLDWAVFFCEYARFLPPFSGTVAHLAGNNLSYKRATIAQLTETGALKDGLYEVFVNSKLQEMGQSLFAPPNIFVTNINSWELHNATSIPYHHGRGYAGMRFSRGAIAQRVLYCAVALVLPGLQTVRISRAVLSRKRYFSALVAAIPFIVLFWSSWSLGEFVGYLRGPGRSLDQWR
jgi:hypothetical protein